MQIWKIYQLDVIAIPTNRPMQRMETPDTIYCTEEEKFEAIADDIVSFSEREEIIGLSEIQELQQRFLKDDA